MLLIKLNHSFAVYSHFLHGQLIFIGFGAVEKAVNLTDARKNSRWLEITAGQTAVEVEIGETFKTRGEALEAWRAAVDHYRPPCNDQAVYLARQPIICNATGTVYPTVTAAAKAHSISKGALSNHLNKRAGYESVRGLTFRRAKEAT